MRLISNKIIINFLVAILLCICGGVSSAVAAGPTAAEYGVVLNLAGKQRMLTQKMSKEIMLMANGHEVEKNLANLSATAALFDKTLTGLRDGDAELKLPPTVNKRIIRQLDKIRNDYWTAFHAVVKEIIASRKVSNDQVAEIAATNIPLLKQMNRCVKLYEKDAAKAGLKSDPSLAVSINLAGKQRMLTQKMSKEFLLIAYGHDAAANKLNLLETATLFDRTLKGLMDGDATLDLPGTKNEAIRKQLTKVQSMWKNFEPVVKVAADPKIKTISKTQIKTLAEVNLPLLKEMNKAVGMFAKEAAGK
jgi:hypothetical protein